MVKHNVLLFLLLILSSYSGASSLVEGVLDLSNLDRGETVSIMGEAFIYWEQHLTASEIDTTPHSAVIDLPAEWNGLKVDSKELPGMGYATIAYKIVAPDSLQKRLAFSIPTIFSSYRLFIDSTEITSVGDPQNRRETTISTITPRIVEFEMESDTAVVVFQISNFINNIGGLWLPLTVGEKSAIHKQQERSLVYDLLVLGGLFVFAMTSLFAFFIIHHDEKNRMSLYYSIFVFLLFIRVLVSGNFYVYRVFPIVPSSIFVHGDYLAMALIPLSFLLYTRELFADVCNKRVIQFGKLFFISFASISILTPLWIHSKTIAVQEIGVLLAFIYSFVLAVRGYRMSPLNSAVIQISIVIFIGAATYDIIHMSTEGFALTLAPFSGLIISVLNSLILIQEVRNSFIERDNITKKLNVLNAKFRSFVPNLFFKLLETTPQTVKLGDHFNQKMTVLFCDIRNLTELSKDINHEEKFNLISQFIADITPRVIAQGGIVDKFVDDSVMCIFPDSPDNAVSTAIDIIRHYNVSDGSDLKVGIGIHFGKMTLGVIGTYDRMESTVIGDAVNTASRMRSLTHRFDVDLVVSSEVIHNGFNKSNTFHMRSLGTLAVKGKRQRTTIEEIFYSPEGYIAPKLETRDLFEQAVIYYEAKQFIRAGQFFENVVAINPHDKAAEAFIESCKTGGGSLLKGVH